MDIKVYPSKISGSVTIPASKSVVHRALIASSLSSENSVLFNVDLNEDILATIDGLGKLGAIIDIKDKKITVKGFDLRENLNEVILDANESGSTLRFLIPLASAKAKKVVFNGSKRLMERPLNVYKEIYENQNLTFIDESQKIIKGKLKPAIYDVRGDVSSQFISGLMFLLPLLNNDSIINIIEPFESKSYVDLTISVLNKYNIKIKEDSKQYFIKGGQKYQPYNLNVEGDFSQAAFFAALAAINDDIVIKNINQNSVQGDKEIINFLKALNVKVEVSDNSLQVFKSKLSSANFDLANTPDLGPILCVLGLFSEKSIHLKNVKRLRLKESDRLLAMKIQLEKIGGKVELSENSITVYKLENFIDEEIVVDGCNDHRIVMAMAILATSLKKPLIIKGAEAINKSYPDFFKDLNTLGVKTKYL